MDNFIACFCGAADRDLVFCVGNGVAYQADMSIPFEYGEGYWEMYRGYVGSEIAVKLNATRRTLVDRYMGDAEVLDTGIGAGEFIEARPGTFGNDVNPWALAWLTERQKLRTDIENFEGFTFWDVLEHIATPRNLFNRMPIGSCVFTSIPIFDDLLKVRASKHYKPNEHLYYFTEKGFVDWMGLHGFSLLEVNDEETKAGREAIKSFAFRLDRK
jgi:hypothetical protein